MGMVVCNLYSQHSGGREAGKLPQVQANQPGQQGKRSGLVASALTPEPSHLSGPCSSL